MALRDNGRKNSNPVSPMGGGGGGGEPTQAQWGTIEGNIQTQSDLMQLFADEQALIDANSEDIVNIKQDIQDIEENINVDDVTIERNADNDIQLKDGGITNDKINADLKATSIRSATEASDNKLATELAVREIANSLNAHITENAEDISELQDSKVDKVKVVKNVDLDTVLETGFYTCDACTNRPTENNGNMIVMKNDANTSGHAVQMYFTFVANDMWVRHRTNGTWGTWEKINGKVDKTNTASQLYGTDASGNQALFNYSADSSQADTIVRRNANGQVLVADATADNHAVSKGQVDDALDTKVDKVETVTTDAEAYIKNPDGTQGTKTISNGLVEGAIPIRLSNGRIDVGDATANTNAVSKGQMDSAIQDAIDTVEVVLPIGNKQYMSGSDVVPTIAVEDLETAYTNEIVGTSQVLFWDIPSYGIENYFRVTSAEDLQGSYTLTIIVHGRLVCTYTWDADTTGDVNPTVTSVGGGSGSGLAKQFVTEFPANPAENTLYFKLKQDTPDINFIDRPTATPTYTYYSLAIPDLLSYNQSTGCWSMTFDGVTSNPFPASVLNATTVSDLAYQGMIAESSASGATLKVDKSKPYNIAIPLNSSGQEMTIPDIVYMKGTTDNILGIDEASQIIYNVDMPSQLNFALNETNANTYNEKFEGMFFPNDPRQVFIQPCTKEEAKVLFFNNKIVKNLTTDEMSISSGYVNPNFYGFVYDTTKILKDGELVEVELKSDLEKLTERVNNKVEKTRKINNKPLTSDITLTTSDFGLANINTPTFGNYTGQALSTLLTNSRVGEKLIWSYKFQASASPTGSADDEWIIRIIRHNASGYNLLVIAYNLNNYNSIYMNRYTNSAWGTWKKVNA